MMFVIGFIFALPLLLLIVLIIVIRARRKREALDPFAIQRLPLWATVKASYKLAWYFRKEYLHMSRQWLQIAAATLFLYNWLLWSYLVAPLCNPDFDQHQFLSQGFGVTFIMILHEFLVLAFGVSIAVAWHRLILRNEHVTGSGYLRVDKVVWNYFVMAVFLMFLMQLPNFIAMSAGDQHGTGAGFAISMIILALIFVFMPYYVRGSVILPARALGMENITLKEVMHRTRGNFWGLFFGPLFCTMPFVLLLVVSNITFFQCDSPIKGAVHDTLQDVFSIMIAAPIYLSFLSLSYQYFFERNDEKN